MQYSRYSVLRCKEFLPRAACFGYLQSYLVLCKRCDVFKRRTVSQYCPDQTVGNLTRCAGLVLSWWGLDWRLLLFVVCTCRVSLVGTETYLVVWIIGASRVGWIKQITLNLGGGNLHSSTAISPPASPCPAAQEPQGELCHDPRLEPVRSDITLVRHLTSHISNWNILTRQSSATDSWLGCNGKYLETNPKY